MYYEKLSRIILTKTTLIIVLFLTLNQYLDTLYLENLILSKVVISYIVIYLPVALFLVVNLPNDLITLKLLWGICLKKVLQLLLWIILTIIMIGIAGPLFFETLLHIPHYDYAIDLSTLYIYTSIGIVMYYKRKIKMAE